jgi:ATP phosphoribosyltransferase
MQLKLALPKGYLLSPTSAFLRRTGLELSSYDGQSRSYRPRCDNLSDLFLKVFHEKDVPIQVAVGNYDLGICGRDWVEELLAKYPSSALVKALDLKYGKSSLYMACSSSDNSRPIDYWRTKPGTIRIATEYPNLAESFALSLRLRRFSIFPLWGAAEAYPPENADLALISLPAGSPFNQALSPVSPTLSSSALLIAHRISWESKDLSPLLRCLYAAGDAEEVIRENVKGQNDGTRESPPISLRPDSAVRLGLPDGHLQGPALEFLGRAGVTIQSNPLDPRRPSTNIEGVSIKMVRPQDMPLQVANGNFDLAVTGEDWLLNHLYRFPSSPVKQVLRLGFGKVRIVAVVSNQLPVDSPQGLKELLRKGDLTRLRVASEYTDVADKYARDNHLSPYRLIPTWGASEAFLPEDADLLIENVQTGRTLAEHNLKVIDTIFESSSCLIGGTHAPHDSYKLERMNRLIQTLQQAIKKN